MADLTALRRASTDDRVDHPAMTTPWRLLRDGDADGAGNMARDEALLETARTEGRSALRLYSWKRPTLSLGAHQAVSDVDRDACRRLGVDLVRRPTGGGAVLHDQEVTYSVTGRLGESPFPRSVVAVYDAIAAVLVEAMALLGVRAEPARTSHAGPAPASCFAAPGSREIIVDGRKLAGSAQLRRRGAFLQHGSILIGYDRALLAEVLPASRGVAPPATLSEAGPRPVSRAEVEAAIVTAFSGTLPAALQPGALTLAELETASRLRSWKYLDAQWTLEGRVRAPVT